MKVGTVGRFLLIFMVRDINCANKTRIKNVDKDCGEKRSDGGATLILMWNE